MILFSFQLTSNLWSNTLTLYEYSVPNIFHSIILVFIDNPYLNWLLLWCESWTVKKAEHRLIDAFELWYWKRLLTVSWPARRSNQSILKEISPDYSLERLILKLKLQYFGHQIRRTDSLERPWFWERLRAGGEGDDRGWDGWMTSLTRWTWVWVSSGNWWWTGRPGVLQSMGSQESDTTERLDWTDWTDIHVSNPFKYLQSKDRK